MTRFVKWVGLVVAVSCLLPLAAATKAQHRPQACARAEDKARPKDLVACECYQAKDPCENGETSACKAYCDKSKCGCCQP